MNALANPLALFDIAGKVAIVTGASGAFGAVAAQVLAGAGAKLALVAGNAAALAGTAAACGDAEVLSINARPSDEAACERIVADTVARFGRVDILVVASGKNDVAKIADMAPARFLDVMDANVTQSWLMARAATRQMLAQNVEGRGDGGKIVLMSSARGLLGHPAGYTAYCASKSAIDGITKALGCELGPTGITVNAIAPTVFRSPLTAWMFEENDNAANVRKGFLARVPKGRLGEPEDLAGPLLFLASKASDFYTGHILYADGGYTAGCRAGHARNHSDRRCRAHGPRHRPGLRARRPPGPRLRRAGAGARHVTRPHPRQSRPARHPCRRRGARHRPCRSRRGGRRRVLCVRGRAREA